MDGNGRGQTGEALRYSHLTETTDDGERVLCAQPEDQGYQCTMMKGELDPTYKNITNSSATTNSKAPSLQPKTNTDILKAIHVAKKAIVSNYVKTAFRSPKYLYLWESYDTLMGLLHLDTHESSLS